MSEITLETNHLIIRQHRIEDCSSHHELLSDEEGMYYLPEIRTSSIEESRRNLMHAIVESYNPERTDLFLRMEERETGELVGEIGYDVVQNTPVGRIVHLGYFTKKKFWNHGYTTEAVQALLRYAFTMDNVVVVRTGCLTENIGSWKVMEKCGMLREAHHRCYVWHDGALKDRYEYAITKEEWEARGE